MIEKEFVPYNESLELKALGFDEPCFVYYKASNENKPAYPNHGITRNSLCMNGITAPLKSQAFRWFREKYNLLVSPFQSLDDKTYQVRDYYFEIVKVGNLNVIVSTDNFQTYEEAELACLRKLIEIVTEYGKRIYFS